MQHVQAPQSYVKDRYTVFLSGSIAMGKAEYWQNEVVDAFTDLHGLLLNPRRDDWAASWRQSLDDPRFVEQVQWELYGLAAADAVLMHFAPATQSPITLLELGLCVRKRLYVSCPDGFWRKGNVEVVCQEYTRPLFSSLENMLAAFRADHTFLLGAQALEDRCR